MRGERQVSISIYGSLEWKAIHPHIGSRLWKLNILD